MRTPGALAQLIPWLLLIVVFYLGYLYGGRKERRKATSRTGTQKEQRQ